ncbi:MAG TPA: 16S rRNA (adenine(1518)-N(6)/adenine(1519)-N(6))-dimethyltransferase RsmA [Candidatus Thermoplasmatota archaeon]|nr:16S rRNA (adenine(1518)-N(6)/adenine(1519)-N(6))-dimethyltransferase RsmA [Candidatus Thermoplasmatota archaeon]
MPRRPPLGQHFLRDARYVDRSIEAASLRPDDVVLEVGPGKGVLTRALAARVAKVVAVEIDAALADALEREAIPRVEVVRGDAVEAPLPRFDACVSNLPYQISSPFLFRLLELPFRVAVLLVQKEFADRLVAKPDTSDYGRLSVNAARRARVSIVARVPPGAFDPPPRVDSAIVRIEPRPPAFEVADEALYARVVEAAFGQRRKKISNALASLPAPWSARLADLPFADARAGELSPEDFARVADHLAGGAG